MYFHFKHNATGWIHWNYIGITLKSHWMGYTGITLKCHWMDTLKVYLNSTAPPAHPNCTSSAPQLHLQCTPTAPPAHLNCTSSAPQLHLQQCTSSAPPTAHLLAPQPHLHICTRTSQHLNCTSQHLNCTSQHHSLYKSMFSHKIRSAPLSTSEVHPIPGALRTSQHLCSSRDIKCFETYVRYECNNNVIKYYGAVIPHDL